MEEVKRHRTRKILQELIQELAPEANFATANEEIDEALKKIEGILDAVSGA